MSNRLIIGITLILSVINLHGQTIGEMEEQIKKQLEIQRLKTAREKALVDTIKGELPTLEEIKVPKVIKKKVSHFGYDFFKVPGMLSLWDNLPVPSDYRLGPGDEIIISLWGETQLRSTHVINRDGSIFIDKVGQVNLTGKSIKEARNYLRSRFEQVYSTLKNPGQSTFMDVSLGGLKSINVKFVGEVEAPGIHPIHPFSTVITGLIQAGGVDTTGSLRNIQVIRNNKVFSSVDLYAFLLKGKTDGDIRLQDQDIVFVPIRESTISIDGAIKRPAIYEARPGETFKALLSYAGEFKPNAQAKLEVLRTIPFDRRLSDDVALESFYVKYNDIASRSVKDGDKIVVHEILPVSREVAIYGQVKKPGIYAYEDSMSVLDLLNLAGGIDDESFWKSIYSQRAEIIRRDEDNEYSLIIPIDLNKLRQGDKSQNILLENLDQVLVRQNPHFDPPKNVTILGEVMIPGVYSIMNDNETLEDIINRAGGFTDRVFEEGIQMFREDKRVVLKDFSIPVAPGDSVYIPEHPGVVFVTGEVHNPGLIHYKKGKSLKQYIESAGGFTLDADKGSISVIYANGDVKRKGIFFDPAIREGATVVVYPKEEREPFDTTEFLKEVASIGASLATIIYIINSSKP